MNRQVSSKFAILLIVILASLVAGYTICECRIFPVPFFSPIFSRIISPPISSPISQIEDIEKFSSEEDFKSYLQESELGYFYGMGGSLGMAPRISIEEVDMPMTISEADGKGGEPGRVSETTVQVEGIDEPDIVKTDGKEIYFSSAENYYWRQGWGAEMIIPPRMRGETKAIKAFPPADLAVDSEIDKIGNLLLHKETLIVFSGDKIYGYNVSDPKSPSKKWTMEIESKSFVTGARLYKDKIYLITKTRIDTYRPCPIEPLSVNGVPLEIKCVDVYHPVASVPVDVTYNAIVFDPDSGEVEKSISFVGSSGSSIVYMSENGIYITYSYSGDFIKFISDFFAEECQDLVPSWLIEKMDKLTGYDISNAAKLTEFQVIIGEYFNSLSDDESLRIENEFSNRMSDYYKEHKRELEKTGIIKVGLDEFDISASGNVPGRPLNQFSLDEYEDHLRIAITVGEGWFGMGMIGGVGESANDVYILDKDLKITGSVKDLGLTERIYSVRFIQDKGYVVTFRQIDPFYVLDLSNPASPELKGELKIPGYSSYLHPITKDKILGIGKEGSKVKISLFDVESPENPSEADKYILDEYWSDVLSTHHAFLLDKKHEIFFMPGSKGGYVFSYKGDELKLTRAVSGIRARRAIYINDYLYIIGDDKITVLNEIDWEEVNELEL